MPAGDKTIEPHSEVVQSHSSAVLSAYNVALMGIFFNERLRILEAKLNMTLYITYVLNIHKLVHLYVN